LQNPRALSIYQLNTEIGPIPLTEEEAPKPINDFVLKCLHPEKHERFASAGEMLEPWKDVMDQVSVGAPSSPEEPPKPQHLGAGSDVRGQQQGQEVLLKGMCIFCKAPVYNSQPRHSNAHGKFL